MHRCVPPWRVCMNSFNSLPVSRRGGAMRGTVLALTGCVVLMVTTAAACQERLARPTNAGLRGASTDDSVRSISGYGRSLGDAGFVAAVGAVDEQRLRVCWSGRCGYGPLAVIQPRSGITDSTSTTLASGEVIARIINRSDSGYIYRVAGRDTSYKFNMHARDTVYWWVGRRGDSLVSVFVSTRPGVRPMQSDLTIEDHGPRYWKQSLARWIWDERDEAAWGTCDGGVCCKSGGIPLLTGK